MIWVNTSFKGHYPVGTAAIVSARNAEDAAKFLTKQLEYHGLKQDNPVEVKDMTRFINHEGHVLILNDGNY